MKKNLFLIGLVIFFFASQVPVYAGQGKGNGNGYGKGRGVKKQLRLGDGSCGRTQDMKQVGSRQKQNNRSQVVQKDRSKQPPSSVKSNDLER
jgi:hypothetical protein